MGLCEAYARQLMHPYLLNRSILEVAAIVTRIKHFDPITGSLPEGFY